MPPSSSDSTRVHDVAIVGAGPAGLSAAVTLAEHGRSVALVDAGARPGGQYWRHPPTGLTELHHDGAHYRRLEHALDAHLTGGRITYLSRTSVWTVSRRSVFVLHLHGSDRPRLLARRLVLATGAFDRQVPFPGWDLPGVYTAGAALALLEEHAVLVGDRVAVGGTGPFLLPVATGLVSRGARVVGVYEANTGGGWLGHRAIRSVAGVPTKLGEGLGYAATLVRARVPVRPRTAVVEAHGTTHVTSITTARLDARGDAIPGTERRTEVDAVAVGWGFTPSLDLPLQLGCRTVPDADGSPVVWVDARQQSSVPGAFAAGETTGVGGAQLAICEGELAASAICGVTPPTRLLRRRRTLRAFAAAMHRAHPVPPGWVDRIRDDTLVCRCEEVDAAALRRAVQLGADNARTAKLLARPGMGWCQGRMCGTAVAGLVAAWSDEG
ncbi:MAG TPA: NAD(P)/FAD-dependent oxidoreductase, partial [Actinopolymorphaceae bacterium]